mgnify:CR=1 FL=1
MHIPFHIMVCMGMNHLNKDKQCHQGNINRMHWRRYYLTKHFFHLDFNQQGLHKELM